MLSWHRSRQWAMVSSFGDWHHFEMDAEDSHGFAGDHEPAGVSFQGPQNEPNRNDAEASEKSWYWKCLVCDSSVSAWDGELWRCSRCNSKDFYQTDRPAKKVTSDGTWMFMPYGLGQDGSRSRRRRRKKRPQPDDNGDSLDERAEEESRTNDPCVDPDLHHGPQRDDPPAVPPHQRLLEPRADRNEPVRFGGGSGTMSSTDGQLLKALQRLVTSKKQDDDWASASGPQKGVRWRGGAPPQPPIWRYEKDDLRAYSKYVKKIEIWKLQVQPFMTKKEMALTLYNSLQGEAEQELEHTPIEDFYVDDGVDKIVSALKGPMEQKAVYQKRKFLSEFENVRRYAGESMRSYVNRFRRTQRCLKSVGIDMSLTYDSESMGTRLLDRSGLSQEGQRLVLVGTQQRLDFELVVESMMLQYPEFRAAPPVVSKDGTPVAPRNGSKGGGKFSSSTRTSSSSTSTGSSQSSSTSSGKGFSGPRRIHFTETENAPDDEQADEFLDVIDEGDEINDEMADDGQPDAEAEEHEQDDGDDGPDLGELAQVLTLTAKKLSSMTLGRKFTGRPQSSKGNGKSGGKNGGSSMADRKRVTHCTACGALGHWHEDPECPMNQGGSQKPRQKGSQPTTSKPSPTTSKTHKVGILHHEHGATEVTTSPTTTYGNMFTVNMVGHVFQQPHEVNEVKISGPEGFAGFMVLDTGCQRTCCGKVWSKAHINYLKEFGLHPNVIEFHDDFRFGKGAPSHSQTKAYYPSGIGEQPLLLAASILDEQIPFLASNSLMTELGAVVSLVHDEVVFMRLQGAKAKIHRLGGHMAISITEFSDKALRNQHDVWKEFEKDVDWSQPPPEYILSSQSFSVSVPSLLQTLSDDPTTSEMVEGMAAADFAHQVPREEHDREHAPGGSSRVASTRSSTSTTTSPGVQGASVPMCTHQVQEVRECSRKVCNVPSVQHQMDLESGKESMGRQALGRGEEGSWIKRSLFALAAFASTFIGDNSELFNLGSNGSLSQPSFRTTCQSQKQNVASKSSHGWPVDQLLRAELPHGAPHGRAVHGSLEHHGAGSSLRASSKELLRGGLLQRGDLQAGAPEDATRSRFEEMGAPSGTGSGFNRGRRDLRLGASGGRSNTMKKGTAKRLKGEWMRSAKTLEAEHNIYLNQKTVKDRPPPSTDLWELFGGRALCSELAHQYDLNALQPWDLIYGYDFMRSSTRQEAAEALDRFKPLLLMLEIDCRHYTLFNKNLNYSSRLDEWEELQRQDRPLRTFTTSMARRQHESGRFFLIENPERSELWSMPDMVRLASLPGVYAFSLDAGAFGAFIDGNPVIKTFRLLESAGP